MNSRKNEYPFEVVEKKLIERITFRKLTNDIGKALNVERGILYILKGLIVNPGMTIRSFLYEKRFNIFHPVRLLILTSAINLFVFWLIDGADTMGELIQTSPSNTKGDTKVTNELFGQLFSEIFYEYFNMMIWLFIPIISVFSYLFFKKSAYNYAEHLVLNAYVTSVGNLTNIISYLFIWLFDIGTTSLAGLIAYLAYNLYAFKSFFRLSIGKTIIKGFLALILGYTIYMIFFSLLIGIAVGCRMAQMGLFDK